jgi:hypothetical protein
MSDDDRTLIETRRAAGKARRATVSERARSR